jgi:predicted cupin superfamily sugar epimerase
MIPREAELVRLLDLKPHPEGGFYREIWRSPSEPGGRAACTLIYFLLGPEDHSRWHRIDADEVWSHMEGGPLELWTWAEGQTSHRQILGPLDGLEARPAVVVPAHSWQAAKPVAGYVLCGCTVAPGFDFKGFVLLADQPASASLMRLQGPAPRSLI